VRQLQAVGKGAFRGLADLLGTEGPSRMTVQTWAGSRTSAGMRKGYHSSHLMHPDLYAATTVYQRAALARFSRYRPHERIVWREARQGYWWVTARADDLERRIMRMARKHERGIRWTVSALARSLKADRAMVQRIINSLVKRALVTFTATRGRYARMVLKVVARSIAQPYSSRDEQLKCSAAQEWDRYSEEEHDKLKADAYAFRSGLAMSLAAVGYEGPNAERDYLRAMGI
jgi:DNA-binding MarR family transcriptional regulator